jgi:hypothetical protein
MPFRRTSRIPRTLAKQPAGKLADGCVRAEPHGEDHEAVAQVGMASTSCRGAHGQPGQLSLGLASAHDESEHVAPSPACTGRQPATAASRYESPATQPHREYHETAANCGSPTAAPEPCGWHAERWTAVFEPRIREIRGHEAGGVLLHEVGPHAVRAVPDSGGGLAPPRLDGRRGRGCCGGRGVVKIRRYQDV